MVKDEVVDVCHAHLGPPQAKIPSELQINCGYDLFQNFQPFFSSWRSGLNQTPCKARLIEPLHKSSRKHTYLSRLIMANVTILYI